MQGFKMFCYLMHQKLDQSNWDLFSRCIYYAASEMGNVEMGNVTVIFVNSNEFGGLLTSMLTRMAPIWQANTAVLLSLARLVAAWRLQHPTLQAPVTLDLSTVVGSACNIAQMEPHVVPQPAPLDLEVCEYLQSDTTGYVYPTTTDPDTIDPGMMTLKVDDAWYEFLHAGGCTQTPGFHLQVFNSLVLWLLSRFPVNQLGAYAEAIHNSLRIWGCATECGSGDDASYITDLKRKLAAYRKCARP
jgi:hypothetical protein